MSVYGWRWWDLSKSGALTSVNGVIWEPNDPIKAECLGYRTLYGRSGNDSHAKLAVLSDGRMRRVPNSTVPGRRKNGLLVTEEQAPAYDCHCGFWAYYDPESAFGLPRSHNNIYLKTTKVFGVVEAWGEIVWHELGFRCEYAQVRAVMVQRGKLHAAYEIPRYGSLDEIIKVWDVTPIEVDEAPDA